MRAHGAAKFKVNRNGGTLAVAKMRRASPGEAKDRSRGGYQHAACLPDSRLNRSRGGEAEPHERHVRPGPREQGAPVGGMVADLPSGTPGSVMQASRYHPNSTPPVAPIPLDAPCSYVRS